MMRPPLPYTQRRAEIRSRVKRNNAAQQQEASSSPTTTPTKKDDPPSNIIDLTSFEDETSPANDDAPVAPTLDGESRNDSPSSNRFSEAPKPPALDLEETSTQLLSAPQIAIAGGRNSPVLHLVQHEGPAVLVGGNSKAETQQQQQQQQRLGSGHSGMVQSPASSTIHLFSSADSHQPGSSADVTFSSNAPPPIDLRVATIDDIMKMERHSSRSSSSVVDPPAGNSGDGGGGPSSTTSVASAAPSSTTSVTSQSGAATQTSTTAVRSSWISKRRVGNEKSQSPSRSRSPRFQRFFPAEKSPSPIIVLDDVESPKHQASPGKPLTPLQQHLRHFRSSNVSGSSTAALDGDETGSRASKQPSSGHQRSRSGSVESSPIREAGGRKTPRSPSPSSRTAPVSSSNESTTTEQSYFLSHGSSAAITGGRLPLASARHPLDPMEVRVVAPTQEEQRLEPKPELIRIKNEPEPVPSSLPKSIRFDEMPVSSFHRSIPADVSTSKQLSISTVEEVPTKVADDCKSVDPISFSVTSSNMAVAEEREETEEREDEDAAPSPRKDSKNTPVVIALVDAEGVEPVRSFQSPEDSLASPKDTTTTPPVIDVEDIPDLDQLQYSKSTDDEGEGLPTSPQRNRSDVIVLDEAVLRAKLQAKRSNGDDEDDGVALSPSQRSLRESIYHRAMRRRDEKKKTDKRGVMTSPNEMSLTPLPSPTKVATAVQRLEQQSRAALDGVPSYVSARSASNPAGAFVEPKGEGHSGPRSQAAAGDQANMRAPEIIYLDGQDDKEEEPLRGGETMNLQDSSHLDEQVDGQGLDIAVNESEGFLVHLEDRVDQHGVRADTRERADRTFDNHLEAPVETQGKRIHIDLVDKQDEWGESGDITGQERSMTQKQGAQTDRSDTVARAFSGLPESKAEKLGVRVDGHDNSERAIRTTHLAMEHRKRLEDMFEKQNERAGAEDAVGRARGREEVASDSDTVSVRSSMRVERLRQRLSQVVETANAKEAAGRYDKPPMPEAFPEAIIDSANKVTAKDSDPVEYQATVRVQRLRQRLFQKAATRAIQSESGGGDLLHGDRPVSPPSTTVDRINKSRGGSKAIGVTTTPSLRVEQLRQRFQHRGNTGSPRRVSKNSSDGREAVEHALVDSAAAASDGVDEGRKTPTDAMNVDSTPRVQDNEPSPTIGASSMQHGRTMSGPEMDGVRHEQPLAESPSSPRGGQKADVETPYSSNSQDSYETIVAVQDKPQGEGSPSTGPPNKSSSRVQSPATVASRSPRSGPLEQQETMSPADSQGKGGKGNQASPKQNNHSVESRPDIPDPVELRRSQSEAMRSTPKAILDDLDFHTSPQSDGMGRIMTNDSDPDGLFRGMDTPTHSHEALFTEERRPGEDIGVPRLNIEDFTNAISHTELIDRRGDEVERSIINMLDKGETEIEIVPKRPKKNFGLSDNETQSSGTSLEKLVESSSSDSVVTMQRKEGEESSYEGIGHPNRDAPAASSESEASDGKISNNYSGASSTDSDLEIGYDAYYDPCIIPFLVTGCFDKGCDWIEGKRGDDWKWYTSSPSLLHKLKKRATKQTREKSKGKKKGSSPHHAQIVTGDAATSVYNRLSLDNNNNNNNNNSSSSSSNKVRTSKKQTPNKTKKVSPFARPRRSQLSEEVPPTEPSSSSSIDAPRTVFQKKLQGRLDSIRTSTPPPQDPCDSPANTEKIDNRKSAQDSHAVPTANKDITDESRKSEEAPPSAADGSKKVNSGYPERRPLAPTSLGHTELERIAVVADRKMQANEEYLRSRDAEHGFQAIGPQDEFQSSSIRSVSQDTKTSADRFSKVSGGPESQLSIRNRAEASVKSDTIAASAKPTTVSPPTTSNVSNDVQESDGAPKMAEANDSEKDEQVSKRSSPSTRTPKRKSRYLGLTITPEHSASPPQPSPKRSHRRKKKSRSPTKKRRSPVPVLKVDEDPSGRQVPESPAVVVPAAPRNGSPNLNSARSSPRDGNSSKGSRSRRSRTKSSHNKRRVPSSSRAGSSTPPPSQATPSPKKSPASPRPTRGAAFGAPHSLSVSNSDSIGNEEEIVLLTNAKEEGNVAQRQEDAAIGKDGSQRPPSRSKSATSADDGSRPPSRSASVASMNVDERPPSRAASAASEGSQQLPRSGSNKSVAGGDGQRPSSRNSNTATDDKDQSPPSSASKDKDVDDDGNGNDEKGEQHVLTQAGEDGTQENAAPPTEETERENEDQPENEGGHHSDDEQHENMVVTPEKKLHSSGEDGDHVVQQLILDDVIMEESAAPDHRPSDTPPPVVVVDHSRGAAEQLHQVGGDMETMGTLSDSIGTLNEEERLAALELVEKLRRRAATLKRRRQVRQRRLKHLEELSTVSERIHKNSNNNNKNGGGGSSNTSIYSRATAV